MANLRTKKKFKKLTKASNGWNEFLAESFNHTFNTAYTKIGLVEKRSQILQSLFPESLKAYRRASRKTFALSSQKIKHC